ncbi:MAG: type III pantothenate kinase [Gammaproteobacteria bacterium]|nr:type III pantothenate kinase [Gammaproteobacteria bacterium]
MILDLDIGNTRIKWRLSDTASGQRKIGVASGLNDLLQATVEQHQITRVRIACVRGGDLLLEMTHSLAQDWQLTAEIAQVSRECQGLTVAYSDLNRLGVDRWLAMLAAFRDAQGASVVVDCGTAMTIDLISNTGRHLGGYIVPGLSLAATSLTQNTAIELDGQPVWGLEPGNSTEEAIYHGALQMLLSLMDITIAKNLDGLSAQKPPVLYLTGGDATVLSDFLDLQDVKLRQTDDLVFEGLALALG